MPAHTDERQPILSVTFCEPYVNLAGRRAAELRLHPGDVLDLDDLGSFAGRVLDALTGRCRDSGPALRYLDMPKEAWPFEDLAKFQVCFRPRAIHLRDGGGSRHADNWPGCIDCGGPMKGGFDDRRMQDAGSGDTSLAALSQMLDGVARQCRVLVIDPLTQFVADQHIASALALLEEHAMQASRVVVFRCREDCVIH